MIKKIKSIKKTVYELLMKHSETRDNDRALMTFVWIKQYPGMQMGTALTFLADFIQGKYADPESIRRARQLIQEKHPETRGEVYYKRHKEAKKVQTDLYDEFCNNKQAGIQR